MFDLVIRGGVVVDGTGAAPFAADVAVSDDRIVEVGEVTGRAKRTIEADGRLVTPGFVDIHTHLDAQLGWDPLATSSCWHGVTSVVMGNCGVTFAPVNPGQSGFLAEMMESVEDIPADSILEGLPWDWETYGGYLDWLEHAPKGVNAGGMVGHCALRYRAMGERSLDPEARPTPAELDRMVDDVDEAIAAGALGFSTSRTLRHRVPDGREVPGTWAEPDELAALAAVLGRHGRGVFGVAPRFDGEGPSEPRVTGELAWMRRVSVESGRPLTFNVTQTYDQGDHWRLALELAAAANEDGARIRPQTTSRSIGVLWSLDTMTPFDRSPAWMALRDLPLDQKLERIGHPDERATLIAEAGGPSDETLSTFYVVAGDLDTRYDTDAENSLVAHAARRGTSPAETFLDLCVETEGRVLLSYPFLNQSLDAVAEMLDDDGVVMGLADSGAHVGQIIDASQPTFMLTYWVRDRGAIPLEQAVRRMTSDTAGLFGLADRGEVRAGAFADLAVIDLDELRLPLPTVAHDFPGGAGRYVQRAEGYGYVVVGGQVFMEDGEHTGVLAGSILRSGPDRR